MTRFWILDFGFSVRTPERKKISCLALCATFFALCSSAQAQQPGKVYRIGFLSGGFPGPSHWTTRLRTALRELGYIEGSNIAIEARYSENKIDRLPTLADELVRLKPDVIVAGGRNDARAAKNATKTIPIIAVGLLDPVADGLLHNLARPGGNLTGFTTIADVLVGKRLELLKESVTNLSRVSVLWNPQDPGSALQWKESQVAAGGLGLQLRSLEVSSAEKLEGAIREVATTRSALATTASAFVNNHRKEITNLAAKNRLAAIYHQESFVVSGGLMSYGGDEDEQYRRVAYYVDRILKGAKPADLPVEQPTNFELVINLKTAQALGLKIPAHLLMEADRVIE
jgi:putative tryptophan/tyrosine transport system substrate-binding protein